MLEIVLAAGKEAIARPAKPLPRGPLVPAHDRPDGLPFRLERLNRRRGSYPVARTRKRLGLLAQRDLPGQVRGVRFALRRDVRSRADEHLVLRRLEPTPHNLALRPRDERDLFPSRLEISHPPAGDVEVFYGLQCLHLATERLLHLQVRPSLPLIRVPQLLRARAQRRARRLETRLDVLAILFRGERRASV